MISCTFESDDKDKAAIYHYFFSHSEFASKLRKKRFFNSCITTLGITILMWFVLNYINPTERYVTLALTVCCGVTFFAVILWENSPKRMAKKSTNAAMSIWHEYPVEPGACTVTMTDEDITYSDKNIEHRYSWPAVHKMAMTDEHMIFIFAGAHSAAIPKAKVDTGVMQQMHQLAAEKVNKPPTA